MVSQKMDKKKSKIDIEACLPEEIILEIFTRLPVKSLCRFKCVSKSILYLLLQHDSSFLEQVRTKPPFHWQLENNSVLYFYSVSADGFATLKHTFKCNGYHKTCSGLVCYTDDSLGLHLYNVATEECIDLPGNCLDLEFCFDPSSDKYRFFDSTPMRWPNEIYYFEMLTLGKNCSWRPLTNNGKLPYLSIYEATVVTGKLFWFFKYASGIFYFNLANEEFRAIEFPCKPKDKFWEYALFEFEGSACFVERRRHDVLVFNLWMLKDTDEGNGWILMKRNFTLPPIDKGLYPGDAKIRPYAAAEEFSSQGGEILIPVLVGDDRYMFFYSFLNGQFTIMRITIPFFSPFRVKHYAENYVSLKDFV